MDTIIMVAAVVITAVITYFKLGPKLKEVLDVLNAFAADHPIVLPVRHRQGSVQIHPVHVELIARLEDLWIEIVRFYLVDLLSSPDGKVARTARQINDSGRRGQVLLKETEGLLEYPRRIGLRQLGVRHRRRLFNR